MAGIQSVRTDRLVVIQWLGVDDKQTGLLLASELRDRDSKTIIDTEVCWSASEFVEALSKVANQASHVDVPFVHIDCHGWIDGLDTPNEKCVGLSGHDPEAHQNVGGVYWHELEPLFHQLAVATNGTAFVMLAACRSEHINSYWNTRTSSLGGSIAIGSYDIKMRGNYLHTASIAFTLERFVEGMPIPDCATIANGYNKFVEHAEDIGTLYVDVLSF